MLDGAGHYIREDTADEIVAAIREWAQRREPSCHGPARSGVRPPDQLADLDHDRRHPG